MPEIDTKHRIQIDSSDRKQAEEKAEQYNKALQEKNRLLEMILDNVPVGIWLNNAECEALFMNKFVQDHFHLSEQELAICFQNDRDAAGKNGPQHYQETVTFKDNKQHVLETVKYKVAYSDGSLTGILGIGVDVTERKEIEAALQQAEQAAREDRKRMELILQTIPAPVMVVRLADRITVECNEAFWALTGYTPAEVIGRNHRELGMYTDPIQLNSMVALILQQGYCENFEMTYRNKGGEQIIGLVSARVLSIDSQPHILTITRDVTAEKAATKALRQSEEHYRMLLERATQAIVVIQAGRFTYGNPHVVTITGYELDEIVGSPFTAFVHPQDVAMVQQNYTRCLAGEEVLLYEFRILRKTGALRWLEISSIPIEWDGEPAVLSFISDITDRKQKAQEIQYHSYHDHLTGLYNRRYYEETLTRLDQREYLPFTMILADVNGLKLTNDVFGHLAGDRLLQTIASAIKSVCRHDDVAARIGGDEFALLLPSTSVQEAEQVVRRLREEISQRQYGQVVLSLSVGWATKSDVMEKNSQIYMQAEDMMYSAKLTESLQMKRATLDLIIRNLYQQSSDEERHAKRVSALCEQTGFALGLESRQVSELRAAGLMHDIGKIGIDSTTLYKQEPLSEADKLDSARHPEIGHHILNALPEYGEIARIVLAHHEHWDGSGYPKGLSGQDIPLASRIVHIAGAYDTMVNGLTYHEPWGEAQAIRELRRLAGSQFDPAVVEVFAEQVLPRQMDLSDDQVTTPR